MMSFIIECIQSLLLIISAILIIIAAVGLLKLDKNQKNVVYARIHIVGIFDMACILTMIALGQYILAGIYFIIAPFAAHAMSYAYFKTEDDVNNPEVKEELSEEDVENNPFLHPKSEMQDLEGEKFSSDRKTDERFSVSTLEISEDE